MTLSNGLEMDLLTDNQRLAVDTLREIPGWRSDDAEDSRLVTKLAGQWPAVDLAFEAERMRRWVWAKMQDDPKWKRKDLAATYMRWVSIHGKEAREHGHGTSEPCGAGAPRRGYATGDPGPREYAFLDGPSGDLA